MAEKTNMTKLIHSMIMKLNDPKPVVRTEIESFFQQLSYVRDHHKLSICLEYEDKVTGLDLAVALQDFPHH